LILEACNPLIQNPLFLETPIQMIGLHLRIGRPKSFQTVRIQTSGCQCGSQSRQRNSCIR
jgi:hypothetical protein